MHVPKGFKVRRLDSLNESNLMDMLKYEGKYLLLLGDGVFIDAYALRKNSPHIYIQRILNMYQLQKTLEDYFYDDIQILSILRLSEIDQWDRDILWNIREALEIRFKVTGIQSYLFILVDQEYCKPYVFEYFSDSEWGDAVWEEIPQAAEWK